MNAAALWLAFRLGARRGWAEKASIVGQCAILWALIVSYGVLFRFIPQEVLMRLHVTPPQLAWYLVLTEIMTCFGSYHFATLQDEIRDGTIEIMLLRPVDFWPLKLAEWLGRDVARLAVVAIFALSLGTWITGEWPWRGNLLLLVPIGLLGGMITIAAHLVIGCSMLWIGEARPVFWLWQKCQFLLGALLCPLLFYPAWLHASVWFTPFPATIAAAGTLALGVSQGKIAVQMLAQLFWLAVMVAVARQAALAVRRKLRAQGG